MNNLVKEEPVEEILPTECTIWKQIGGKLYDTDNLCVLVV